MPFLKGIERRKKLKISFLNTFRDILLQRLITEFGGSKAGLHYLDVFSVSKSRIDAHASKQDVKNNNFFWKINLFLILVFTLVQFKTKFSSYAMESIAFGFVEENYFRIKFKPHTPHVSLSFLFVL